MIDKIVRLQRIALVSSHINVLAQTDGIARGIMEQVEKDNDLFIAMAAGIDTYSRKVKQLKEELRIAKPTPPPPGRVVEVNLKQYKLDAIALAVEISFLTAPEKESLKAEAKQFLYNGGIRPRELFSRIIEHLPSTARGIAHNLGMTLGEVRNSIIGRKESPEGFISMVNQILEALEK